MGHLLRSIARALILTAFWSVTTSAAVTVDEGSFQVEFNKSGASVSFLASSDHSCDAVASVSWIDSRGSVIGSGQAELRIRVEPRRSEVTISAESREARLGPDVLWDRLSYVVDPREQACGGSLSGLVSMSRVDAQLFVLRASSDEIGLGDKPRIALRAEHPITGAAIEGVTLAATLVDNAGAEVGARRAVSGPDGISLFEFPSLQADDVHLHVEASIGRLRVAADHDLWVDDEAEVILQTDKPIYQPGETIHMRGVVLKPNDTAAVGVQASWSVYDDEYDEVLLETSTATRFGVLAAEYQLPEDADLGSYSIELRDVDEESLYFYAEKEVTVSRYERPPFEVSAKPAVSWVAPGEQVRFDVEAKSFVGKPVSGARVRLSEIGDDGAGTNVEGVLDKDGRAVLRLTPRRVRVERYGDRNRKFVVSVEDPLTGRTETAEATVTVSSEPVRISVRGMEDGWSELGERLYIAAWYPGRSPAQCDIRVTMNGDTVWEGTTNKLGTVVSSVLLPPSAFSDYGVLEVEAIVDGRRIGLEEYGADRAVGPTIRISTDQTVYQRGDSVRFEIQSTETRGVVSVVGLSDGLPMHVSPARLRGGRATGLIAWQPEFKGVVYLQARLAHDQGGTSTHTASVEFDVQPLEIDLTLNRDVYKPSSVARLRIDIADNAGKPTEAALGVWAVDEAILRRAEQISRSGFESTSAAPSEREVQETAAVRLRSNSFDEPSWNLIVDPIPPAKLYGVAVGHAMVEVRDELASARADGRDLGAPYVNGVTELLRHRGVPWESAQDPWGNATQPLFDVEDVTARLDALSAGPDEVFDTADDIRVALLAWPYFEHAQPRVAAALAAAPVFPESEDEFFQLMRSAGIENEAFIDPWGRQYMVSFGFATSDWGQTKTVWYGVIERINRPYWSYSRRNRTLSLMSGGPHGDKTNAFEVAKFYRLPADGQLTTVVPRRHRVFGTVADRPGIEGVVSDSSGAVIPGAVVTATSESTDQFRSAVTAPNGRYRFSNLTVGLYTITMKMDGFQTTRIAGVPVHARFVTQADGVLEIGSVTELVEVEAAVPLLRTESTMMAVEGRDVRVRNQFPETLLWAPLLETNRSGRARLRFNVADQITDWNLTVFASTADGRIAQVERPLRVFQPFYLEYDPPQLLTSGDRVEVPLVVRNYADSDLDVALETENTGAVSAELDSRVLEIASGTSAAVAVQLDARGAIGGSVQRLGARAQKTVDAIEKSIAVRPDGAPRHRTLSLATAHPIQAVLGVPESAVEGTIGAQLMIFDDPLSHTLTALEGLVGMPHGCGEQTISSTYPNLLVLSALQARGERDQDLEVVARGFLKAGYERLLGYRSEEGGFRYFTGRPPDEAVTSYALEFLSAASEWIDVDPEVVSDARRWLERKLPTIQSPALRSLATTAIVTTGGELKLQQSAADSSSLYEAAARLKARVASRSGDTLAGVAEIRARLENAAEDEATPFYGWGRAGHAESLGLALLALQEARLSGVGVEDGLIAEVRGQLLALKDQKGLWHTTQATVRALVALLREPIAENPSVRIFFNGSEVSLENSADDRGAITVDVGDLIRRGGNEIRIETDGLITVQAVASYTEDWETVEADSEHVSLAVEYADTDLTLGQSTTATVRFERRRGGGMVMAEVGLPPGAEVSVESLERAVGDRGSHLHRYEVLPDRVVLYLWPRTRSSGEVSFEFRPRLVMDASSGPSRLYDYYNPDAEAMTKPVRFRVQRGEVDASTADD